VTVLQKEWLSIQERKGIKNKSQKFAQEDCPLQNIGQ